MFKQLLIVLLLASCASAFVDDDVHEFVCAEHLRQIWGGTWPDQNYSNMTACSLYPQHGFPSDFWVSGVDANPGKHYCSSYSCPAKDWANHWSKVSSRWADEYINGSRSNDVFLYQSMCAQCIADHFVSDLQEGLSKEQVLQKVLDYNWNQNGSTTSFRSWNPSGRTSAQLREVAVNIRKCEERMTARCDDEMAWVMENVVCDNNTGSDRSIAYNTSGCPPCLCPDINPKEICPPCAPERVEVEVEKVVEVPQLCPKPPKCPECDGFIQPFLIGLPIGFGGGITLCAIIYIIYFFVRRKNVSENQEKES